MDLPARQTLSAVLPAFDRPKLTLITGPSGIGKSTALAEIERKSPGCTVVQRMTFPADRAVVEAIAPWASLAEAGSFLTACGLGEPRLWLRPFQNLSDGEKFRAQLAKALGRNAQAGARGPLLCDEFCCGLHRRLAKAIAFNFKKAVERLGVSAVIAASMDDFVGDLQPDVIVRLGGLNGPRIERLDVRQARRAISLRRGLRILPGSKCDYSAFAAMHYRASDELGFVDKVFVMREAFGREPLGIVIYSHAPLELAMRNQATQGWFSRNPRRVNRSLRILRRLVIHPDVRGCGLGHYLVRRTLPLVGTEFVECLASMGEFNPVFEKAGMKRIGQYPVSPRRSAALVALRAMGIEPNSREFVLHVCRNREVREIVARVVYDWYRSTTGGGERRVARQAPELLAQTFRGLVGARPVYYLWQRGHRSSETDSFRSEARRRRAG